VQIPAEERALRARFGAPFDAYARRVNRWLGAPRAGRPGGPETPAT
jgi:protein-S-isoprenylcysteine O-methyltransferase Ste14